MPHEVRDDKNGFMLVAEDDKEGWFPKQQAVLVENAVVYFNDLLQRNPQDNDAYVRRAVARRIKGELDKAISDCHEAIRLAPQKAAWRQIRGTCWLQKNDFDKAIADFEAALRLDTKAGIALLLATFPAPVHLSYFHHYLVARREEGRLAEPDQLR